MTEFLIASLYCKVRVINMDLFALLADEQINKNIPYTPTFAGVYLGPESPYGKFYMKDLP